MHSSSSSSSAMEGASSSSSSSASSSWSIAVKTVGQKSSMEPDFYIQVSPEDDVTQLFHAISQKTGLDASQQRLIYRGRLITTHHHNTTSAGNSSGSTSGSSTATNSTNTTRQPEEQEQQEPSYNEQDKIRNVVGLADGQTIHLVPRNMNNATSTTNTTTSTSTTPSTNVTGGDNEIPPDGTTPTLTTTNNSNNNNNGASLLAALLGLATDDDDDDDEVEEAQPLQQQQDREARHAARLARWRPRSRPRHRLTEADIVPPDPGTLEPVRQGLLTLHTLLPDESQYSPETTATVQRQWYRGQWLDCRDTVNQWLEATVVEVLTPNDILTPSERIPPNTTNGSSLGPTHDPPVGANDWEGRRQLLLDTTPDGHVQERNNNEGVQLLLIHYNGWAARWDEWIRSDSERIRPFRTRTRHNARRNNVLPTIDAPFSEAPPTYIHTSFQEEADRACLVPELHRVVSSVNALLGQLSPPPLTTTTTRTTAVDTSNLPWSHRTASSSLLLQHAAQEEEEEEDEFVDAAWRHDDDEDDDENISTSPPRLGASSNLTSGGGTESQNIDRSRRRQLERLAPLLDRLGRTLTEAAPHVALYAASLPRDEEEENDKGPALTVDMLRDGGNVVVPDDDQDEQQQHGVDDEPAASVPSSGGGLFSFGRRRSAAANRNQNAAAARTSLEDPVPVQPQDNDEANESTSPIDPDYVDFVNGRINTVRGEVRDGGRGSDDGAASLLGAYLAAASLSSLAGDEGTDNDEPGIGGLSRIGRLLRQGETNGTGGIDIHIHAIVTGSGPGMGFGTTMAGQPTMIPSTATRTMVGSRRGGGPLNDSWRPTPTAADEDDDGIFDELYSENPSPLDAHSERGSRDDSLTTQGSLAARDTASSASSNSHLSGAASLSSSSRNRRREQHAPSGSSRRSLLGRMLRRSVGRRSRSESLDPDSNHD